jgi:hypothetical protein
MPPAIARDYLQPVAQKHMAQLQHNMLGVGAKTSALLIINQRGRQMVSLDPRRPLYQTALAAA